MNIQPYNLYCQTASTTNNKPVLNSNKSSYSNPEIRKKFYYIPHAPIFFEALKKSKFQEMDLACVEKFKAPIEKFNSNDDLQDWSKEKLEEDYIHKDFGGRQKETQVSRKEMLKEWNNYVTGDKSIYKPATALLIMSAITRDLKPNNDNLPPVLNKKILADTVHEVSKNLESNKKYLFDMNKIYRTNLRNFYTGDKSEDVRGTKWVMIPSQKHDPEHFDKNVEKLKMLSYKTWCTKNTKAKSYLHNGDFHIYLENGNPKICIRFIGDNIEEIQGERNNRMIPSKYADETEKYFLENNFSSSTFEHKIKQAKEAKMEFLKLQKKYKINKKDSGLNKVLYKIGIKSKKQKNNISIFKKFGITSEKLQDGTISISQYKQPSDYFTYADIGIDENELFKNVSEIKGNANFRNTALKSLNHLQAIYGNATFANSNLEDLGDLKLIKGNAKFVRTNLKSLNKLEEINGNLGILGSDLTDLGALRKVKGSVYLKDSNIESLKNLEYIGKDATFSDDKTKYIGHLKEVGGDVILDKNHCLTVEDFIGVKIKGSLKINSEN